ncbi:hypothetical protein LTR97_000843 [Elasticomyces elasticus]|uniref:Uncharacterized protein n=1 Tax=Elasticomyces elasticus TaxID=574655 RepID=A0AAN8A6Y0_9PEZI|nr:hypothetical protein LTR97_000843 [Elasticomyces elasticus]
MSSTLAAQTSQGVTSTLATSTITSSASLIITPLLSFFTAPPSCNPASISTWTGCSSSGGTLQCAPNLDDNCLPAPSSQLSREVFSPGVCPESYYAAGLSGAYSTSTIGSNGSATATALIANATLLNQSETIFVGIFPTIQVAWAVSDLPLFTPASAPVLQAQGSTGSATSTPPPNTKGISKSAWAGIGVGIGFACLFALIGVLIWWLVMRRRRNRLAKKPEMNTDQLQEAPGYELDSKRRHPYAELGDEHAISELPDKQGQGQIHEADAEGPVFRHELEGDFTPVEVHGNSPPIGVVYPALNDEKDRRL